MESQTKTIDKVEVLVVEDSPTQARILQNLLIRHGHEVTVAQNGRQALDYLQHSSPTVVISDVIMPEIDGYELCRYMKADNRLKNIPVILLTTLSDPSDIIRGLEVGANNFITKPYDEQFLCSRIQHILINMDIRKKPAAGMGIELFFAGKRHFLTAERIQMLDLLISSFEAAVQKYHELEKTNMELEKAHNELKEAHALVSSQALELQALSLTDELTGLHNRRGFLGLGKQLIKIADRSERGMLLFFIDLDNMKWINDNLGHQEGDQVLIESAEILRDTFRDSDIIARLGGDEFVALLIDVPAETSEFFSDRLNTNLAAHNARGNPMREISMSLGIAVYNPEAPCSIDELVSMADNLMYKHKRSKRSRRA